MKQSKIVGGYDTLRVAYFNWRNLVKEEVAAILHETGKEHELKLQDAGIKQLFFVNTEFVIDKWRRCFDGINDIILEKQKMLYEKQKMDIQKIEKMVVKNEFGLKGNEVK